MKEQKKKRGAGRVLLVVALSGGLLLCAGLVAAELFLSRIGRVDPDGLEIVSPSDENFETEAPPAPGEEPESSPPAVDPGDVEWDEIEALDADGTISILLIGQDRRPGQGRQRSDAMLLCSVNTQTSEIAMISFLRDLYVRIPGGYSDNRLNAAYAFGGFPLLSETLALNFGVDVDAWFEVDFEGFSAIVELLGGVDIELTEQEAAALGGDLAPGVNHLNGAQALAYAGLRKLDSDFGRTARQRKVLQAILAMWRGRSLGEMVSAVGDFLPYLSTDLTNTQILALAAKLFPLLSGGSANASYSIPPAGMYEGAMIRGMSVLVPDLPAIREYLQTVCLPLGVGGAK